MIRLLLFFVLLSSSLQSKVALTLVDKLPYDNSIFTQGIVFYKGNLYMSGGLYGQSALYKYDLSERYISKIAEVRSDIFAEGITIYNDKIVMLSWKKQVAFVYDVKSGKLENTINYSGEGWGLSNRDSLFVMSNGSDMLQFFQYGHDYLSGYDVTVEDENQSYDKLNELEWIDDYIYANVWYDSVILKIEAFSGRVVEKIYPMELIPSNELNGCGVLNGIAYNKRDKLMYITGKNWNYIYLFKIN